MLQVLLSEWFTNGFTAAAGFPEERAVLSALRHS